MRQETLINRALYTAWAILKVAQIAFFLCACGKETTVATPKAPVAERSTACPAGHSQSFYGWFDCVCVSDADGTAGPECGADSVPTSPASGWGAK